MESQHFGHSHPLAFNEEQISNQTKEVNCSRCGEMVSGPSYSCVECGFYLHQKCAEAPSKIDHPFHQGHPLILLPERPHKGEGYCNFCSKAVEMFFYHSSRHVDLHIKCALFTLNIAEKKLGELEHIAIKDPSTSTGDVNKQAEYVSCFVCRQPLLESTYFSLDCGFNLHKKCAELSHEISHPFHAKHPLVLQFVADLSCNICQDKSPLGLAYFCSPCNFTLHVGCAFPPPTVESKNHQHSFILFLKQVSFICDVCGTKGNDVAYICSTCILIVHRKCTSFPRIIKLKWHQHPYFFNPFLSQENLEECRICHEEVNKNYGSYSCSVCHLFYHVNCATMFDSWYDVVDPENIDDETYDNLPDISKDSVSCIVLERNEERKATRIRHFGHVHDLMLGDHFMKREIFCDGCMLFISTPFYYCSQCNFFLHKTCAELSKEVRFTLHACSQPHVLMSDGIFKCSLCEYEDSGFGYKCYGCNRHRCVRCFYGLLEIEGHPHRLVISLDLNGQCNACGGDTNYAALKCRSCDFFLHHTCATLPRKVQHKCDEHPLILTYQDQSDYSEYHYCDICEERRNPNHWFYHCAICETSVHVKCALGKYSFIKRGSIYKAGDHLHPLTFVEKAYYSSGCLKCGEPCQDLALECAESGCNYIVHWECVKPSHLRK